MAHDFEQLRNQSGPTGGLKADELSRALGSLPRLTPPAGLGTSLRVIASRQRQRALTRGTLRQIWAGWRDRAGLVMNNCMRPFALPFAGGLLSAMALFVTGVVPNYVIPRSGGLDVPTMLTTGASLKETGAIGGAVGDLVLDVTIDDQGRMVDYSVVSGGSVLKDAALRRRLENMLLFTEFIPATSFGQPTSAKVRIPVFTSQIDVKG